MCHFCFDHYEGWVYLDLESNLIACQQCVDQWEEDKKKEQELMDQGHSYHCAIRQVSGDGECECDLYGKGYDPYAWMRQQQEDTDG